MTTIDDDWFALAAAAEADSDHPPQRPEMDPQALEKGRRYSLAVLVWLYWSPVGTPRPRWEDYR